MSIFDKPPSNDVSTERQRRADAKRVLTREMKRPAFQRRVTAFIDAQLDGKTWKEAATECGIPHRRARWLYMHPRVLIEMSRRASEIRTAEAARNPVVLATIRDRAMASDASAAQQKASIEAARLLESRGDSNITIHGGNNVIAGYVIKLDGPSEGPRQIGRRAPMIDHAETEE